MPRLSLKQAQAQMLAMSPRLQQAIKLLQLSNIELAAYVEQELECNPLLERQESNILETNDNSVWDGNDELNSNVNNVNSKLAFTCYGNNRAKLSSSTEILEQTLYHEVSLYEYLVCQINLDFTDPMQRLIAARIIDQLDEAGYYTGNLQTIAKTLNCSIKQVEEVLFLLQQLNPPGIFARNLAECLAIQLKERDHFDSAMQILISNLDMLASYKLPKLMKLCGVDAKTLTSMINEIRTLNPKPTQVFNSTIARSIIPDVLMYPAPQDRWIIKLNPATLPQVFVNNVYYAQIKTQIRNEKERQYITECLQSANWFAKMLHQRADTILKVATAIVSQQSAFFIHGVRGLKPLALRDIAEKIKLHESTVSRVTSNKFISTPYGCFELKYFFTPAIASSSGEEIHSAESVRYRIRTLIDSELPSAVFSDDKIVDILRKERIDIARRTVAKYREIMKIPSSAQRRRRKSEIIKHIEKGRSSYNCTVIDS